MILLRLLFALAIAQVSTAYRLNVPRVLLPYHPTVPVSFVLEVTHPIGGCFHWRSTRPDIVSVKSIDTTGAGCSDRAEIRSVAKPGSVGSSELSAVIFAEDKGSGTTLSCGVTVDEIATISIETTTKVLFVDAAPARMTVDAFNADGDRFSTLSELALEWELSSTSSNKAKPLRIVPFEQSTYEAPSEIVKLEKNRKKGYLILIEGVGTGTATLTTKFSDSYLQKVAAHNVELAVVANLLLVPSQDIYMPVHSVIPFQVLIVKQRGTEIVTMPNPSYELVIDGGNVASLDKKTSSVRALTTGNSAVHLLSSHVDVRAKAGLRPPSTVIHVVDPESVQWHVSGENWMLETGKQYTINVELLDEHGNVMFVADNSRFDTHVDENLLRVDYKSQNGTWLLVTPLKPAKTTLRTKFVSIIDANGKIIAQSGKIGGEQRATLVDPVKIVPPVIYLPYVSEKRAQIDLTATGGSGVFDWSSEDGHIATVELATGRLTANSLGNTVVVATDKRNDQLRDRADVHVLEVSGIGFGETVRETFVGENLELNLKFTGVTSDGELVEMSDCRNIRASVQVSDNSLLRHESNEESHLPKVGTGCGTVSLKGLSSGDARVTVSYMGHKASIDVAVYEKLKISEDSSAIALGSSHPLVISGGPRPWILDPANFYKTRENQEKSSQLQVTFENEKVIFKCSSTEGTEAVRVRVGNQKSSTLPLPIHSTVTVSICCAKPTRLEIFDNKPRPAKCPLNVHSMLIQTDAELVLRGSGACNGVATPLASINGLSTKWQTSDSSLVKIKKQGIQSDVTTGKKEGVATIEAHAGSLTAKYEITVSNGLTVEPSRLVLWNEAVSKGTFTISGGSGHFHVDNLPTAGAPVSVALRSRSLSVTPKNNGQISLRIADSCLIGQHADAEVRIADIHSLAIDAPQFVEIGQEVEVEILAQDETGASFEKEHRPLADAQLDASNQHVILKKIDGLRYTLRANSIGTVSLSATSKSSSGRVLSSRPHNVQIFSPIFLQPKRLTLIPDAKFQLEVVGGPQPTPPLDFSLNNSMIASIEPNALITSSELGWTSITGTVRVGDGHVTKDTVILRVASLGGIVLSASSQKVETGGRVNLRLRGIVAGAEDEEPFAFGGAIYPFKVTWSVSDPSVLSTTHPLGGDVVEPSENQFAIWFDAIRGGSVTVRAVVELNERARKHFVGQRKSFTTEITVTVEDALSLIQPEMAVNSVRVAPNSQLKMVTVWSQAAFSVPSDFSTRVSITSDGFLRTNGKEGSAVVAVRKLNSPDNETVLIPVTVSRVASLDVHPTSELRSAFENSPIVHLPVGAQIQLNVIPRDIRGRRLSAASNSINFRPHRFDLTDIIATNNNQTLTITLKNAGDTVLRIGDAANPSIATFIRLSASESILPRVAHKYANDLVVSDVICLQSNILSEDGSRWSSQSSSEGRINWLDEHQGVAQLAKAGNTFVRLHTSQQTIHSKISVLLPTSLRFPEQKPDFVSNDEHAVFMIPVTAITNNTSKSKISSIYGDCTHEQIRAFDTISAPFECQVAFVRKSKVISAVNWLTTSAVFSPSFGYGCEIRRLDSSISTSSIVIPDELLKDQFDARVTAKWASDGTILVADAQLEVPFHFAFNVEEKELVFSNMNQIDAALSVWVPSYDAKNIVVSGCEGDIVNVAKTSKITDKHSAKGNLFYNIHLNVKSAALFTEHAKKCQITVENTLTGQVVRVPVTVQLLDETAKQVFNALESRGIIDVLLILAQQYSHIIPTLLWTCLVGIIILAVAIYVKMNIFDKSGSFGDNTLNNSTHQTSMASSLNSTNVSLREPVFRSTPIAGSPQVALPTARERLRNQMGSSGDNRLWSY
ncbi:hypothetical protein GCK72_002809 [Caenorhabditis remanei]|uniref:BIG2 domain-containing protein n=2 Tax=Caenorhabditis remanei TaxID=31234 RepID=A0A6A5HTT7_CAERE|nr:hypothetical protein GCK72_002809 [Caenorhabditis remanei]KAF1770985.1 hypothetical protein GCK72_002809 [Caenorhabditis remanei]